MEITNREITNRVTQILTTVNYNDGCIKRIKIYKEYAGNKKTPASSQIQDSHIQIP